jgi:hypothetical protein
MAQKTFADFLARGVPFGDVVDGRFAYDALRDTLADTLKPRDSAFH